MTLKARVRNAGARAGSAVLQVYVAAPGREVPRPAKEFKAFARLDVGPGETREAVLELAPRDFAYWDVARSEWRIEGGAHAILGGFSAADLPARATVELEAGAASSC